MGAGSEEAGFGGALANETNIINGSGLSGPLAADESNLATVTHAGVSLSGSGNAWATIDAGSPGGDWFTAGENDGDVVFEFDLGAMYNVDSFAAWGYHFGVNNGNSIKEVTLDFSTDGGTTYGSSQAINVDFPSSPNLATIVDLTATNANYIKMTVTDNHFGDAAGGDRVGIAEIRFTSATAVPEPTSLGILGLGVLGLVARRRRRS